MLRVHASLFAFSALSMVGCSSEDPPNNAVTDTGVLTDAPGDTGDPAHPALAIPCGDTEDAVYGAPGTLPNEKGAIIKCAPGERYTKEALEARARMNGYTGKAFTSGAKVYRILYRTERGDPGNTAGYSSAIVYLPDVPRAAKSPLLLVGHGSRGQMAKCASSRLTPEGEYVRGDFENMTLPLVGAGLPVIAPDGGGYANYGAAGNPPSTYGSATDLGKSMLDGTRAFKKLAPSLVDDNVVLFGHSQGGHTALATLALSESYGLAGTIKAAVTFAPLWLPQRSWGALLLLPSMFDFATQRAANAVSIWYHYTHGELLDGPGRGGDVFKPEKRALIKQFVDTQCWSADYPLMAMMGKDPSDIFTAEFASGVGGPAGAGSACPTDEPKKSLCEKWLKRYLDDRPHLTGNAAKVPILFLYGNKDTTIPPERVACSRDRLKEDMAAVTYCVEADAAHDSMLKIRASYAIDWLLARTTGAPEPAACPLGEKDIAASCNPVPPND